MPAAHSTLVIGGGIAGPVAATALAMAGIDVEVYEARPSDPPAANGIGGSLALEPNGLAALRIVDADDAVLAAAIPITRSVMSIASRAGHEVPTLQGLPPRQLIDRGALHRILRDRAEEAGVRIHDGKKLIGVDERPDGVTAHSPTALTPPQMCWSARMASGPRCVGSSIRMPQTLGTSACSVSRVWSTTTQTTS
ncbi:MAG: FAD-dependent monooxygenase, partial [Mycobacterium sp.]